MMHRPGFSLIEAVMFIAVFVLVTTLMTELLVSQLVAWGEVRSERAAVDGAVNLLDRINHEIQLAQSVNVSNSVFGTSPGSLEFVTFVTPTSSVTTTVDITLTDSQVRVGRQGQSIESLNATSTLRVTELVFHHLATSTSEGIRTELSVEAGKGRFVSDKTIRTFVILRGGY